MREDSRIFTGLRRWVLWGWLFFWCGVFSLLLLGFCPCKTPPLSIFYRVGQLSASDAVERHRCLGNDLGNCPASVSHSNSPSQIRSIIFGQSNVSHCHLRQVQKGPPNGSHFCLFLKIQRLLKEQLDKIEDWRSLIFLFQWNETPVLFFFPLPLKARVC